MRLDGEVTTGIFGADAEWERWLAGVALSVSEGDGSFDQPDVDSGTVESTPHQRQSLCALRGERPSLGLGSPRLRHG